MIVKIASHIGFESLKNGMNYIMNDLKTFSKEDQNHNSPDSDNTSVNRAITYITNDFKVKKKYVSGYLCTPETAEADFMYNAVKVLNIEGHTIMESTGHAAIHIVQSFPDDLDISHSLAHQCGIDLIRKLKYYQGVVATHVEPVMDKNGVMHGKVIHNHIIISAYRYFNYIKIGTDKIYKYNDCKASYRELQKLNDEIAIEHNLPVIVKKSNTKATNITDLRMKKIGYSWKQKICEDIDKAKSECISYEDFINKMKEMKYQIRDKKYITFTNKEGKKVRGYKLGPDYSKKSIQKYYGIETDHNESEMKIAKQTKLKELVSKYGESIRIETFKQKAKEYGGGVFTSYIILNSKYQLKELHSICEDKMYNMTDTNNNIIGSVQGSEIIEYLHNKEIEEEKQYVNHIKYEFKNYNNEYISYDYSTKYWYTERLNDERRRYVNTYYYPNRRCSALELLFLFLLLFLDNHYEEQYYPSRKIVSHRDERVQKMVDELEIACKIKNCSIPNINHEMNELIQRRNRQLWYYKDCHEQLKELYPQSKKIEEFEKNIKNLNLEEIDEQLRLLGYSSMIDINNYKLRVVNLIKDKKMYENALKKTDAEIDKLNYIKSCILNETLKCEIEQSMNLDDRIAFSGIEQDLNNMDTLCVNKEYIDR